MAGRVPGPPRRAPAAQQSTLPEHHAMVSLYAASTFAQRAVRGRRRSVAHARSLSPVPCMIPPHMGGGPDDRWREGPCQCIPMSVRPRYTGPGRSLSPPSVGASVHHNTKEEGNVSYAPHGAMVALRWTSSELVGQRRSPAKFTPASAPSRIAIENRKTAHGLAPS